MAEKVGVIGLGIMGSAFSRNLIDAGFEVFGRDVDAACAERFANKGGSVRDSPAEVVLAAPIVIISLPSVAAFRAVVSGPDGLASSGQKGAIVVECSTLPIPEKEAARDTLAKAGITLLDCPVSGTGSMAVTRDISVYGSGDETAFDECRGVFASFARHAFYVGPFGNGSKFKFVANLLVHIHNAASAEAMVLAMKAGLDPQQVYDVISAGAGASKVFEVRGQMMVEGNYQPATMKIDVWRKDMEVIGAFARDHDVPVPLFAAAEQLYHAALAGGLGAEDTAAICAIYEDMAGIER